MTRKHLFLKTLPEALILIMLSAFVFGQSDSKANLRLAHFSSDAPKYDLVINNQLLIKDVAYTDVSGYLALEPGKYRLYVYPHRAPQSLLNKIETDGSQTSKEETATPLSVKPLTPLSIDVDLKAGAEYTLMVAGFFNPPPPQSELGDLQISMEAGPTVKVIGPGGFNQTVTESRQLRDLIPGVYTVAASQEGFESIQYQVEISPDTLTTLPIALKEASDSSPDEAPTDVDSFAQALTSETSRELTWQRTQLYLYEDSPPTAEGQEASIRLIHASPITTSVDVYMSDQPDPATLNLLSEQLSFPNDTDRLTVAAGHYLLRLSPVGTKENLISLHNLVLEPKTAYTFYIVGSLSDSFTNIIPKVDQLISSESQETQ
ncbi:MAG: DUF4397 domain-containing protein [Trueperaceae bacterium]|nr:DUF4397 domain-containing protein [Trueperaceae bacterium]